MDEIVRGMLVMVIENAPAVGVLLIVVWRQGKQLEACVSKIMSLLEKQES